MWWRFVRGRYRFGTLEPGDDVDIAMPYPRAERGALNLKRWLAPWREEMPRAIAVSDFAAELVWLVPGLLVLMPHLLWPAMVVAAVALRYAGHFRHQRAARADNLAVHGRFWDRILDLPVGLVAGPPYRQAATQSAALNAVLRRAEVRRRTPVLAALLFAGLGFCVAADQALALVIAIAACLGGLLVGWLGLRDARQGKLAFDNAVDLGHDRGWVLGNMADLRGLSVDTLHLAALEKATETAIGHSAKLERARLAGMLAHGWVIVLGLTATAFAWMAGVGSAEPREMLLVVLFGAPALYAAVELGRHFGQTRAQRTAIEAIAPIMESDVSTQPGEQAMKVTHVSLRRVAFSYTEGLPILSGVDLDLQHGDIVALSGPSGFGKSTLLRVLMGLATPTSGDVLVNDVPLSDDRKPFYRRRIAAVFQDQDLGFATIRNAVLQDMPGADLADAWGALEAVGLGETVRDMPMGIQTLLVAGAFPFSLMQQILIARALVQRPDLLVLDETLSALDVEIARSIVTAAQARGAIVVFSTHRLDLLSLANKVIRLNPQHAT